MTTKTSTSKRQGRVSPRWFGALGVHNVCLGPDGPPGLRGERLVIHLYDKDDNLVRRLEQVEGATLDPGYVDFFGGPNCRPAVVLHPIVDIALDGTRTTLMADCRPGTFASGDEWAAFVGEWAKKHGRPQ